MSVQTLLLSAALAVFGVIATIEILSLDHIYAQLHR